MSRRTEAFFLLANLLLLVAFSAFAFSRNETNLLDGLDGAYMMTIVRQQAVWGSGPPWGLTNNMLQSLGGMWYPLKTMLMPEYAVPLIWNHGDPVAVASFVAFATEAFLAAYLLGLCLGRGAGVASAAGWIFVLTAMPYFGLPKIYGVFSLLPHLAALRLFAVLGVLSFRAAGRVRLEASVLCLGATLGLLVYLCISEPIFSVLMLPVIAAAIVALMLGAEDARERWVKIAGGALILAVLAAVGLPQFLYGLYRYTAAYVFRPELLNVRQSWYDVSIAFQNSTWGIAGPLLFGLAAVGGVVFAWTGRGLPRLFAVTMLLTMASLLAFGAFTVNVNFWQGPSPLYFEVLLWPFYAAYAAGFLHVLGTQLARLARHVTNGSVHGWVPAGPRVAGAVCLACAGLPWVLLGVLRPAAGLQERNYPYPPRFTPMVGVLRDEVGLHPGARFRGRVATLTGQSLPGPVRWAPDLTAFDNEVLRQFGNDHRVVGLWYYGVPTLFEYNQFLTPPFYLVTRTFLALPRDRQMRNVMVLRNADPRILRALGVRFVIVDAPVLARRDARLRLRMAGTPPLLLYELDAPNLGTYSPVNAMMVRSAHDAIAKMSPPDFDPSRDVVAAVAVPRQLVPATRSTVTVGRDGLHVSAQSAGTSLLLLPFEYSRCLDVTAVTTGHIPVQVFRADLAETGLLFNREVEATLTYVTGLFHHDACRIEDARDVDALGIGHEVR